MKMLFVSLSVVLLSGAWGYTQEAKPAVPAAEATRYLELVRQEAELTGQFKLAKELTDLHTQRAEEATKANRQEKTPWETEVAKELRDRTAALASQLEGVTKERTGLEEKAKVSFALLSTTTADTARSLTADESAYLTRLESLLFNLDQELTQVVSTGKTFVAFLQTNTAPEEVARTAAQIEENTRMQKLLDREKSSLEVQKLLFRALKK